MCEGGIRIYFHIIKEELGFICATHLNTKHTHQTRFNHN